MQHSIEMQSAKRILSTHFHFSHHRLIANLKNRHLKLLTYSLVLYYSSRLTQTQHMSVFILLHASFSASSNENKMKMSRKSLHASELCALVIVVEMERKKKLLKKLCFFFMTQRTCRNVLIKM